MVVLDKGYNKIVPPFSIKGKLGSGGNIQPFPVNVSIKLLNILDVDQDCISCGILLSGTGARGVSSEHMENVEMFSENCALVWLSENRDLVTFVDV